MSTYEISATEQKNKRTGKVISTIVHSILILLLIFPFMTLPDPPPGQEGILISFGQPDIGSGEELAEGNPDAEPEPVEEEVEEAAEPEAVEEPVEEEVVEEPVEEIVEEPEPAEPEPTKAEPEPSKDVLAEDRAKEIAIKRAEEKAKKKAEEVAKKKKAEADAKKKKEADAAAAKKKAADEAKKKKAAADAAKKAAAEAEAKRKAEAAQAAKDKFGYKKGQGGGKGNTGTPGNQGDPNGNDKGDIGSTTKGKGSVGGGLSDRGVVSKPTIRDNSQKTGKVRVNVCVNNSGKIVSAVYTQKGSTTTDSHLKSIAISNAKKYKFTPDPMAADKQCGHITFTFEVN